MLKRQLALRLNNGNQAEADTVWHSLPTSCRQKIAQHHARLIERAAKCGRSAQREDEKDDSHKQTNECQ
jgi:hypothetical protein